MKSSKRQVLAETTASSAAQKLSTLDVAAMHTPSRFGVAISSSILLHALFFGFWASRAILNPPELERIQVVSFVDENEEPPEKAPELKPQAGLGADAVKAPEAAPPQASAAESRPTSPPPAAGNPGNAGESAEAAEDAKVKDMLSVFNSVSEDASPSGGVALNLPTPGTKLTSGRSTSKTDGTSGLGDGLLGGNGSGGDAIIDGIVGEATSKSPKVKLAKTGKVSIGGIGNKTGSPEALGARSEESLREVLNKYMGRLQYIYNKHLKLSPEIGGKVEVEVTINSDGTVGNAVVLASEIQIPQFTQEITDAIRHWKYDTIVQGQMKVVYPILFVKMN